MTMECPLCHGAGHLLQAPTEDDLRFARAIARMTEHAESLTATLDELKEALRLSEDEDEDR